MPIFLSFEQFTLIVNHVNGDCMTFSLIYRPPNSSSSLFLQEFEDFLESTLDVQHHVILGDFNVHYDSNTDPIACSFKDLVKRYCYIQHVDGPTHNRGHTLDLVLSRSNERLVSSISVHDCDITDHYLITLSLNVRRHTVPTRRVITYRNWRKFDIDSFRNDLLLSNIMNSDMLNCLSDMNALTTEYNNTLSSLLHKHAPLLTKTVNFRSNPA